MSAEPPWLWRQAKPTMPSLTEQLVAAMLTGKRVLFLDDDRNLGDLVKNVAEKYDMELSHVTTSLEARKLLDQQPFDAAILDINVVNGNGVTLYRWLRESYPRLQVIFLTGLDIEGASDKVHAVGSAPVYAKPTLWKEGFMEDLFEKLGCRRKIGVSA